MSREEHLFVAPDPATDGPVASLLGAVLGFEVQTTSVDPVVYTRRLSDAVPYAVSGDVGENIFRPVEPEPFEDQAVYDDFPIVWTLRVLERAGERADVVIQRLAAYEVFRMLTERLPSWSVVLVHEFAEVVAAYSPQRGVRDFPAGTRADGAGRDIWG